MDSETSNACQVLDSTTIEVLIKEINKWVGTGGGRLSRTQLLVLLGIDLATNSDLRDKESGTNADFIRLALYKYVSLHFPTPNVKDVADLMSKGGWKGPAGRIREQFGLPLTDVAVSPSQVLDSTTIEALLKEINKWIGTGEGRLSRNQLLVLLGINLATNSDLLDKVSGTNADFIRLALYKYASLHFPTPNVKDVADLMSIGGWKGLAGQIMEQFGLPLTDVAVSPKTSTVTKSYETIPVVVKPIESAKSHPPTATKSADASSGWNYNVTKFLGVGSFGIVFKVEDVLTGVDSAVKIVVGQTKDLVKNVERECKIMDGVSPPHENVVRIISHKILEPGYPNIIDEYVTTSKAEAALVDGKRFNYLFLKDSLDRNYPAILIRMQLCGPTLQKWLLENTLPGKSDLIDKNFELRKKITAGIINGMIFLHSKQILHRDLKPENIYFSDPSSVKNVVGEYVCPVKLGDFGQCRQVPVDATMTQTNEVWSKLYRAREAKEVDPATGQLRYGPNADWFSVGLILFELFHLIQKIGLENKFADLIGKKGGRLVMDFPETPKLRGIIIGLTRKLSEDRVPTIKKITDPTFVIF